MTADTRRFLLGWVAPVALVAAAAVWPLASGVRTLVLRDVLNTHLGMRAHLASAIRGFELPLVDPLRAGGQGLAGNPNVVPFYPDNLLLLVASDLWQLNAHFWIHGLLALAAMYWLGREWGLAREGAWTAAACYGFSGYLVAQMNLYNAVAGAALAPALAAALLRLRTGATARRGRDVALAAAIWALVLLGGDPVLAVLALGLALLVAASSGGVAWRRAGAALALGALVAAPQYVEMARLLAGSFRGFEGRPATAQANLSPGPAALVDLLVPFFFGRPSLRELWGNAYFGGRPALYYSLAPGAIALAAAAAGCRAGDRRSRAALAVVLVATALAYSGGLAGAALARLPGGELFRYSVKFVLGAAVAGSLLAGRGVEAAFRQPPARRTLAIALLALLGVQAALAALFVAGGGPLEDPFRSFLARGLTPAELERFRDGWAVVALVQLVVCAAAALAVRLGARAPAAAGGALLALHAATQLVLLRPMLPTDEAELYLRTPPLAGRLDPGAVLHHGEFGETFGTPPPAGSAAEPDPRLFWLRRRHHEELYSWSGLLAGRRYELDPSPEGLDAFPVHQVAIGMRHLRDRQRVAVLAATGVDRLLLPRVLEGVPAAEAEPVPVGPTDSPLVVYRIARSISDAQLVGATRLEPVGAGVMQGLLREGFDPRREAILSGEGAAADRPPGTARVERFAAEEIRVEVDSPAGGALVLRRAWLPIWEATIDGAAARVRIANLTRLAVEVPAGRHVVRLFVDRTPLRLALAGSLAGLAGIAFLAARRGEA